MSYTLLDSLPTVQVFSPTLVSDGLICTLVSEPSGSILLYTIPQSAFVADRGAALLGDFSDAVEVLMTNSEVIAAAGVQGLDASNLLYDAVLFTVQYVPAGAMPGEITGAVEVPVDVITADIGFSRFLTGGSASARIQAEYLRLQTLAGG